MNRTDEKIMNGAPTSDQPRTGSLSDRVYDHLSESIIRGRVEYGEKLNIKAMAAELQVSPMPIRDALKRLELENLVVIKPRSTCFVRIPTKNMTLQALEIRYMLEMSAIRKCFAAVTADDLGRLNTILQQMYTLLSGSEGGRTKAVIDQYIDLDRRYHTELCSLARNDYLGKYYRETDRQLCMSFRYGVGVCHGLESTYQEHVDIYRSLLHNSADAVDLLDAHLTRSRQNILNEPTFQMLEQE